MTPNFHGTLQTIRKWSALTAVIVDGKLTHIGEGADNNGNLYSAGICHMVALMVLLHHCVHQTHIKHHAKTILLMLIKQHIRL